MIYFQHLIPVTFLQTYKTEFINLDCIWNCQLIKKFRWQWLKQQTLKYHRNQQENIQGKHSGHSINNILTFPFTFIATIGHSIVDRQYLQLGHDQEAVNCPNEAFKQLYMPTDLRTCCLVVGRSLDSGKIFWDQVSPGSWRSQTTAPRYAGPRPGATPSQIVYRFLARKLKFSSSQSHKQTRRGKWRRGEGGAS